MPPVSRKPSPRPATDLEKPADAEKAATESTPLHDEIAAQLKKDLENANPEDVTQFQEDDDPLSNVGEIVDDPDGEEENQ
jgi:hypothetical protein